MLNDEITVDWWIVRLVLAYKGAKETSMPRCILTTTLTFGLVAIPLKLYTAASPVDVEFNLITPNGNRVKQKLVDVITGEEVEREACLKGYEHSKNQYVTFTAEEIKAAEGEKSNVMEIKEFVPAESIDILQVEKSYYLGPGKGGDKGYTLIAQALDKLDQVAVATWSRNGKEQLIIVRPYRGGLIIHQMYYANETRDFDEIVGDVAKVTISPGEGSLAEMLIKKLASAAFDPEKYQDGYYGRLTKLVEAKIAGRSVEIVAQAPQAGSMMDLADILAKSLSEAQKAAPPTSAPKVDDKGPAGKKARRGGKTASP